MKAIYRYVPEDVLVIFLDLVYKLLDFPSTREMNVPMEGTIGCCDRNAQILKNRLSGGWKTRI